MAKQVINNADLGGVAWNDKTNANFTELYNNLDAMQSFASLYLPAPETLSITAGTPESLTTVVVVRAKNFEMTAGGLIYTGLTPIVVKVDGAVSLNTGLVNNSIPVISFAQDQILGNTDNIASQIERKVGTGADVGAVPVAGTFSLITGSRLDFYCDIDINADVEFTKANFTVEALEIV